MKKAYGRMFPPYIDAYHEFEAISKKEFLKELLASSNEWADAAIGRLFLNNQLCELSDLLHTPIYIGTWDTTEHYGVFLKAVPQDGNLYSIEKIAREYDYNYEWDRT